jgi:DNA-binding response OmpR family regulator
MKIKILVLDHDETFTSECRSFFTKKENYFFYFQPHLESAIKVLMQDHFDIVIAQLDLAIETPQNIEPFRNLFSWMQSRQIEIPILALGQDITKEKALELLHLHAFALIEKPYSFDLLEAKLEEAIKYTGGEPVAVTSRGEAKFIEGSGSNGGEEIEEIPSAQTRKREFIPFLGVEMDYDLRLVRSGNTEITLTPSEFMILEMLVDSHGRRISREEISHALWGKSVVSKNTLNTHLYNLKNKIPSLSDKLKVIYGSGYVLSLD